MVFGGKCKEKKRRPRQAPPRRFDFARDIGCYYFFFAAAFSRMTAWAAARRAIGTRYGEQET